jgi:capsular polysaccharide transport system permease protein
MVESAAASTPLTAAEVARQMRHRKARRLARNLAIWVGLPTLLSVLYFGAIARNQYESSATVVLGGANPMHQAVILREYTLSRDMLRRMEKEQSFSQHFKDNGDFVAKLRERAGSEKRFAYFKDHVRVDYDQLSQVLIIHARAFTPEAAQKFASALLAISTEFLRANAPQGTNDGLVVVSRPNAPTDSTQPRRIYGIVSVFFASLALFGIGSLLIASIREHAHF